eukprot:3392357-Prymnesium_polylepis.2
MCPRAGHNRASQASQRFLRPRAPCLRATRAIRAEKALASALRDAGVEMIPSPFLRYLVTRRRLRVDTAIDVL